MKTDKIDNNGKEIDIGDRVKISVGFDFQASGVVILKNGGIFIKWDKGRPTGCDSDMLYSYCDIEIIDKYTIVPFHSAVELGDKPTAIEDN